MDTMTESQNHFEAIEYTATSVTRDFVNWANSKGAVELFRNDHLQDIFVEGGVPVIPPHIMAHVLLQWVGALSDPDSKELSREAKAAALEFAEVLGPDHAQTLYRLAVLVTKLA